MCVYGLRVCVCVFVVERSGVSGEYNLVLYIMGEATKDVFGIRLG